MLTAGLRLKTLCVCWWDKDSESLRSLWCKPKCRLIKLHWFFFPALWDKQAMECSEDLDTFNSPTQALRAWPKRKWIFCILFHVIFVAFKSSLNYSCDMRKGFSDTVCESAVGRVQKGPLSHSYCCYCGLVKLYSVFKETESISFHLIWLCPLFHVTFCTANMFCQTEETCWNGKIKHFCLRDALMWEKMHCLKLTSEILAQLCIA